MLLCGGSPKAPGGVLTCSSLATIFQDVVGAALRGGEMGEPSEQSALSFSGMQSRGAAGDTPNEQANAAVNSLKGVQRALMLVQGSLAATAHQAKVQTGTFTPQFGRQVVSALEKSINNLASKVEPKLAETLETLEALASVLPGSDANQPTPQVS